MKKFFLFILGLFLFCAGCQAAPQPEAFKIEDIDLAALQTMLEDQESFVLMVERENCPFCTALNDYIDQTKEQHGGLTIYRLDTTDYHLMRREKGDQTLISDTDDGKAFLELFPYFLYTPTLYQIEDGVPVAAGIGYDEINGTIDLWDVNSSIDWNLARPVNVWGFLSGSLGIQEIKDVHTEISEEDLENSEQTPQESDQHTEGATL